MEPNALLAPQDACLSAGTIRVRLPARLKIVL